MKLSELLKNTKYALRCFDQTGRERDAPFPSEEVRDLVYNSGNAERGKVFVALRGKTVDGHRFLSDAYERGTRLFVVEELPKAPLSDAVFVVVEDTRKALSEMSDLFFGSPSSALAVIGITGTKGKTTTANYIYELFNALGTPTGIIGTNGAFYGEHREKTLNSTPESYELHRLFRAMLDAGMKKVVMEVSSQGLMLHRAADVHFSLGIFTNLHHDHIGPKEHESFEEYVAVKGKFFELCPTMIINADDPRVAELAGKKNTPILRISTEDPTAEIVAEEIHSSMDILKRDTSFRVGETVFHLPAVGVFNVHNALSALAALEFFGEERKKIAEHFSVLHALGRMEVIEVEGRAFILDYAHNRISLESTLSMLSEYKKRRLITVFGSIGGRAVARRKEMAEVAEKYSDFSIITTDNPDFEDPQKICHEIRSHFSEPDAACVVVDRESAIREAFRRSEAGDIVLVAGKGHEDYQIVEGKYVHYSDRESILKLR